MAFWEAEKNKLGGLGKTMTARDRAIASAARSMTPAQRAQALKEAQTRSAASAGQSGGVDPNAVAASIPPDVKIPTDVVLPPSRSQQTQAILTNVVQTLQAAKAKTAQIKQLTSQIKSLKGFFGFGAANLSPVDKANVANTTKQAASDAKAVLNSLMQTKTVLAQHRQNLLQDKAQIANENAKIKNAIQKKTQHKGIIDTSIAKIPKTISQ